MTKSGDVTANDSRCVLSIFDVAFRSASVVGVVGRRVALRMHGGAAVGTGGWMDGWAAGWAGWDELSQCRSWS